MTTQTSTQSSTPSSSTSGTSLLLRLQDHDALAWKELVELYAPLIFSWCKSCHLDSADAADIMQEVFTAASRRIDTFQPSPAGTLRGWLWTITQNKIRDSIRKLADSPQAAGGTEANFRIANIAADEFNDDDPTTPLESHQLLHRALEQIKDEFAPHTWTAFWRSTVDGHDTNWIAEDLNLSPNSVRQAKSRILRRLRQQLGN